MTPAPHTDSQTDDHAEAQTEAPAEAAPLAPLGDDEHDGPATPPAAPTAPTAKTAAPPIPPAPPPAEPEVPLADRLVLARARGSIETWSSKVCAELPLAKLSRAEIEAELAAHPDYHTLKAQAAKAHTDACAARDKAVLELERSVHEAHHRQVKVQASVNWGLERVRLLTICLAQLDEAAKAAAQAHAQAAPTA